MSCDAQACGEHFVMCDRCGLAWPAAKAKPECAPLTFARMVEAIADWLDNRVSQQWRIDLAGLIADTPRLDWLLLTKRIENYGDLAPWFDAPDNVWLGVTAEDQYHFERRWDVLQSIPARVRFISYEPALGPLSLCDRSVTPDWIICGGESGPGARPMDPQWASDLRNECAGRGIAFFMKQMTGKAPIPADLMVRQFPR